MVNNCEKCIYKSNAARKLTGSQIYQLSIGCASVALKKGDLLMRQGALSSNIAYLKTGLAKIHITGPYHEQIIKLIKAPTYLGIPNTFGDKINNYSVTVVEPSLVCFIDLATFKNLLAQNDKFAYEIMLMLCNYEIESFRKCAARTQKQIRSNIADVLLDLSNRIYNATSFNIPLSRNEIGNLIDTSRESVSRILSEFESDGVILITGKKVKIIDKKKLQWISDNS
ncbi:MAG: Crp/Fnr family transcriptional regulator [Prolixibacteraceae bacterium]|jgi:CRP-like cAMP-binding protein|nr:Crp/Fnr family transcriptional regulator [Prolixibacteraceae bacterium]